MDRDRFDSATKKHQTASFSASILQSSLGSVQLHPMWAPSVAPQGYRISKFSVSPGHDQGETQKPFCKPWEIFFLQKPPEISLSQGLCIAVSAPGKVEDLS